MEEIKIQVTDGEVILKTPQAGPFADAMEAAEEDNGKMKMAKMFNTLLPYCIKSHPWGTKPVKQAVREISTEDYLKLFNKLKDVINISGDVSGK